MNKVILMGRLTDEPKVRAVKDDKKVAEFVIAVDRYKEGADFPRCVAWDKRAEFVEKYCHKGGKFLVEGRIQTGSYEKDGHKVYTTDVMVDSIEFCEKKEKAMDGSDGQPTENPNDGWMNVPDGIDEELPFV